MEMIQNDKKIDDNDNDFVMLRNMLLVQQFEVSFIEWI